MAGKIVLDQGFIFKEALVTSLDVFTVMDREVRMAYPGQTYGFDRIRFPGPVFQEGLRIDRALIEAMGVLPDFRYPDNIRLGIAPLYTSYAEIHEALSRLRTVVEDRLYEKYPAKRPVVT